MKTGAPKSRKGFGRKFRFRMRRLWRSLLVIDDTPHRVAMGCAIGTFVAFQPIVGIQMICGAVLAIPLRANVLATLPPAWLTNPVTILPIFYFLYWLGSLFTGGAKTMAEIEAVLDKIKAVQAEQGTWSSIGMALKELTAGFMLPMVIGGAIVGTLLAALFYWLTLRAVSAYQKRKVHRRLAWLKSGEPSL